MKKTKIANKLFIITSVSLLLLLGLQLVFQGLFLEKFYISQKKSILEKNLQMFQSELLSQKEGNIEDDILIFSQKFELVSGIVNLYGFPIYGFDTGQSFINIKTNENENYKVYLEGFTDNDEIKSLLKSGETIAVEGVEVNLKNKEVYPNKLQIKNKKFYKNNNKPMLQKSIMMQSITPSVTAGTALPAVEIQGAITTNEYKNIEGTISSIYISDQYAYRNTYRQNKLLEEVSLFLNKSAKEKTKLKVQEIIIYESIDEFIGVENVIGISPIILNGQTVLLVAMMSLEQIRETSNIMIHYTIIIFAVVYAFSLAAAYIYSKTITKPLVELSNVTSNIATLDFTHRCEVKSKDEIGELAANINVMSAKLKETLDELNNDIKVKEKVNEERKQFIADVSHELKTPLTVLKGICEGIENGLYDISKTNYIETMLYHINDMGDLVQELLDLSRIDKEVELKMEVFDLTNSLLRIHKKLKPLIQEKKLTVNLDVEESIVIGDKKKIEVVIKNIYLNAILYTPTEGDIDIWTEQKDNVIQLNIENKGVKIEEDRLDKLWEAFYRIEPSRNKKLGGSGLGLYMVKQILEKHHENYGLENTNAGVKVWFEMHMQE